MIDSLSILELAFMQRALVAGAIAAVATGILGVYMSLRKEAFIADGVAHGSLAGIAIGLVFSSEPLLFALITAVFFAITITWLKQNFTLNLDTAIGIVFPVLFAIGIIIISAQRGFQADLNTYLFGNILAVSQTDLVMAAAFTILLLLFINHKYTDLLFLTFDPESAYVKGVKVKQLEYLLICFQAVAVVVAVQLVGIILTTSLFVISAASARIWARNFRQMFFLAVAHNLFAVVSGLILGIDYPAGPALAVSSFALFALGLVIKIILRLFLH